MVEGEENLRKGMIDERERGWRRDKSRKWVRKRMEKREK